MHNRLSAILTLIHEAKTTRTSKAGRRRVERACSTLDLDAAQTKEVLQALEYWDDPTAFKGDQ